MLKRGFALVRDADGQPLNSADAVLDGQALVLEFADGKADATGGRIGTRPQAAAKPKIGVADEQGALVLTPSLEIRPVVSHVGKTVATTH